MTTEPPVYEDWNGDTLEVFKQADDIRVSISQRPDDDYGASVDIPFADVRKVTAAMHEKAGLPDRWAALKGWVGAGHESWCADVLARMGELEAGQ